ncbi:MAG: DUF4407 domain-containing protein [Bacteroidetes bacterium]|nr:DUF4407 domain-containing protein [Bacteroidota bacterium]
MENQENYRVREYLWNLAGFKKDIIRHCKIDEFHVTIISVLLLMVGIYATLAWTFFFQTVTDNLFISITGGLFMGIFIVSFDRALIASLSTGNTNILSLGFRLMLAFLLGLFLSQPMILKFYEPEVQREAQILMDQKIQERKEEFRLIYATELDNLEDQMSDLESDLDAKKQLLVKAELDFKAEMDGSGGTGQWGYNTVSKQKEKILARHQEEYDELRGTSIPKLSDLRERHDELETKITTDIDAYRADNGRMGTLIQASALESLITKDESGTLRNRILLLTIILTLIELSALIAKLLFKTESYKAMATLIKEEEVSRYLTEKEIVLSKLKKYKTHTLETELQLIQDFFDRSQEVNSRKLDSLMEDWSLSPEGKYKDYWKKFKETLTIS